MGTRNPGGRALAVLVLAVAPLAAEEGQLQRDARQLREAGIGVDGPALLAFLRQNTTTESDGAAIQKLIVELGDDLFRVRERASTRLVSLGSRAAALLQKAARDPDPEVRYRVAWCLKRIETGTSASLLACAARLLGDRKPDGAAKALLDFAPFAERSDVTEAVLEGLSALAVRGGQADPAVLAGLTDARPERRLAAGVALARAGLPDVRGAVRKLLQDPVVEVRLRVAVSLAYAKDKEALPALVQLLEDLPLGEAGPVQEVLYRLAGDKAPEAEPGNTPEGRKLYRVAWEDWLKAHRDDIDLGKLTAEAKLQGHTLVVLLDAGTLIDLDDANKERFRIQGTSFPLDAQHLPGDRVLVAEYEGGRVSERNRKGEVVWEKRFAEPLVAQRLPNGHTFIASATALVEVDRAGREVLKIDPPQSCRIMKAQRLPSGQIACIGQLGGSRFFLLDRTGKVLRSFAVELRTSGGRVDVLPGGNVLVPERDSNRVAEYDVQGKPIWTARFEQPVAAVRLPNGHTLITGMNQTRAVEIDRKGKEVWEYRADVRVTRAIRH